MNFKELKDFGLFEFCIRYPYSSSNRIQIYLSILMSLISSVFIIPFFVLFGYMFKLRSSAIKSKEPPKFENYKGLARTGWYGFISYIPLIFLVLFGSVLLTYTPYLAILIGFPIYIWPVVSIKFAETENYKDVYDGEIIDIVTKKEYIKYYVIYLIYMVYLIFMSLILGIFTLGFGFILALPLVITFRASFWSYAIKEIRIQNIEDT